MATIDNHAHVPMVEFDPFITPQEAINTLKPLNALGDTVSRCEILEKITRVLSQVFSQANPMQSVKDPFRHICKSYSMFVHRTPPETLARISDLSNKNPAFLPSSAKPASEVPPRFLELLESINLEDSDTPRLTDAIYQHLSIILGRSIDSNSSTEWCSEISRATFVQALHKVMLNPPKGRTSTPFSHLSRLVVECSQRAYITPDQIARNVTLIKEAASQLTWEEQDPSESRPQDRFTLIGHAARDPEATELAKRLLPEYRSPSPHCPESAAVRRIVISRNNLTDHEGAIIQRYKQAMEQLFPLVDLDTATSSNLPPLISEDMRRESDLDRLITQLEAIQDPTQTFPRRALDYKLSAIKSFAASAFSKNERALHPVEKHPALLLTHLFFVLNRQWNESCRPPELRQSRTAFQPQLTDEMTDTTGPILAKMEKWDASDNSLVHQIHKKVFDILGNPKDVPHDFARLIVEGKGTDTVYCTSIKHLAQAVFQVMRAQGPGETLSKQAKMAHLTAKAVERAWLSREEIDAEVALMKEAANSLILSDNNPMFGKCRLKKNSTIAGEAKRIAQQTIDARDGKIINTRTCVEVDSIYHYFLPQTDDHHDWYKHHRNHVLLPFSEREKDPRLEGKSWNALQPS
jgi:hypothetical protein